jgi:DMSO/TMAO reductase YedYZ heme-binding membrane subunit
LEIHEDFTRHDEPGGSISNRAFGLALSTLALVIFIRSTLGRSRPAVWALFLCAGMLLVTWIRPRILAPICRVWSKLGRALFTAVSHLALIIIYYGVATPTALIQRALGKDPLRLHRESGLPSYWIVREPPGPHPKSMKEQF